MLVIYSYQFKTSEFATFDEKTKELFNDSESESYDFLTNVRMGLNQGIEPLEKFDVEPQILGRNNTGIMIDIFPEPYDSRYYKEKMIPFDVLFQATKLDDSRRNLIPWEVSSTKLVSHVKVYFDGYDTDELKAQYVAPTNSNFSGLRLGKPIKSGFEKAVESKLQITPNQNRSTTRFVYSLEEVKAKYNVLRYTSQDVLFKVMDIWQFDDEVSIARSKLKKDYSVINNPSLVDGILKKFDEEMKKNKINRFGNNLLTYSELVKNDKTVRESLHKIVSRSSGFDINPFEYDESQVMIRYRGDLVGKPPVQVKRLIFRLPQPSVFEQPD
jgi:hypothetical protein